ncbi:MAG: hypothetical protein B6D41_03890 [Chloroflexi bacterium UTCFX4]|jgi:hypothetical protein|nr:MAG: hypothetical protein B6D41_03890 [Chloroflexi bacterium UTCFX4]
MNRVQALVTLAPEGKDFDTWQKYCEQNWREYAERCGYDLMVLTQPLDSSERARTRKYAWQKCLLLEQEWASQYEQIVWLEPNILINPTTPSIAQGVPLERVGAVTYFSNPSRVFFVQANRRGAEYWVRHRANTLYENSPREYYLNWGLPPSEVDEVAHTGVLVLSPRHHRQLLRNVYDRYEDKGASWHHEMRPLSYELLRADCVHWLDARFNLIWLMEKFLHYPFLLTSRNDRRLPARLKRRLGRELGIFAPAMLYRACATTSYLNSFFLNFAETADEMRFVDLEAHNWRELYLDTP